MSNVPLDVESYLREHTGFPVANRPFGTLPVIEDLWLFIGKCIGENEELSSLQHEVYGYAVATSDEVNPKYFGVDSAFMERPMHHMIYSNVELVTNIRDWIASIIQQIERSDNEYPMTRNVLTSIGITTINCNLKNNQRSFSPYPNFEQLNDIGSPTILLLDVTDGSSERIINIASNAASQNSLVLPIFFSQLNIDNPRVRACNSQAVHLVPIVHVQQSTDLEAV